MSADTGADGPMVTTGVDAVDYGQFNHLHVEGDLLVYGLDSDEAWLQSDTYVDLEAER
jgi:hypothetical protein